MREKVGSGARSVRTASRTPFVMLVLGLLSGGLVSLLVVNTTLAANSIEIIRLQQANSARAQRVQQLNQQVGVEQSAAVIAKKAAELGMKPEGVPTFVDLRTRSISAATEPAP